MDKASFRQSILLGHLQPTSCFSHQTREETSSTLSPSICMAGESKSYHRTAAFGDDVVIVAAYRTALCKSKRGGFKDTLPDDLLAPLLKALIEKTNINPGEVGDIVVGTVLAPGSQRATECRMAAFYAGFPETVPIRTVNRQCSSGLQAVADVAACIKAGFYDIGIGAGLESMTFDYNLGFPHVNPRVESFTQARDCLLPMGITSENVAERCGVTRQEQDQAAVLSHQRAAAASGSGKFRDEIIPVFTKIKDPKTGEEKPVTISVDDGIRPNTRTMIPVHSIFSKILQNPSLKPSIAATVRRFSSKAGDDEWNDAWETAWLPEELSGKTRAPWETDVNFSLSESSPVDTQNSGIVVPSDIDSETKAFVEDMTENWEHRKGKITSNVDRNVNDEVVRNDENVSGPPSSSLYSLKNMKEDYRLKKQRVHAGLWMKEIEKLEEANLADSVSGGDDIEKLLDSCSEIFDSANNDLNNSKIPSTELKNKPDGWETTARAQDGSIWEMSQREEDILLQEFERRIAFNKFQIASFIKTHIFSRRRPIDGWKYMIEQIGPNAKKGKGSVSRLPSVSDAATQPFKEENAPIRSDFPSNKGR